MSGNGKAPVFAPGGGGGAGTPGFNGGAGASGQVELLFSPAGAPTYNVVRFLLAVPQAGDTNGAIVAQFKTTGKVATCILTYTTASSGSLVMTGKDSGGTLLFTSTAQTAINGELFMISMELTPGATIGYNLEVLQITPLIVFGSSSGTASASGSVGSVTEVDINPSGTLVGSAIGHVVVQYGFEALSALTDGTLSGTAIGPIVGWAGELAGNRFTRLCGEEGIDAVLVGNATDTPAMGAQPDDKLINVLQQVEDLDRGLLFEPKDQFGLGYRTYTDLTNQSAYSSGLVVDYSKAQLSQPFQPTQDDQLTHNDITVSRTNGSSVRVMQTTGPMSTLDPTLGGVGDYTYSIDVNAFTDSQLTDVANKILALGTVDDFRYPQITFDLARSETMPIFGNVTSVGEGDFIQIINAPTFLTQDSIRQLIVGSSMSLNAFQYTIQFNCVPERPFEI